MSYIEEHLNSSSQTNLKLLEQKDEIQEIADALLSCLKNGGEIISCGNGGSACDAMHFTEELIARYKRERPGIKARHLGDAGTSTCWANDYNYDDVYARQIKTLAGKNDAVVVFSTSGNSKNILKALEAAKENSATSIALLGKDGGAAKGLADHSLVVPSDSTANIQEAHITLVHIFCELIETQLF